MIENILLGIYFVFVVGWFVYWFGTHAGDRILNRLSNIQLHCFAFLCGSLLVALSLAFGYFVLTNFLRVP